MFTQKMKAASFEFVFYNLYLKVGLVLTFTFENSNSGIISHQVSHDLFLYDQYSSEEQARTKISLIVLFSLILMF